MSKYTLEDNVLLVSGDEVATINDDLTLSFYKGVDEEAKPAVRAWFSRNKSRFSVDHAEEESAGVPTAPAPEPEGLDSELTDAEYAQKHNLPAPPKMNPRWGDKTQKYVQWLSDHRMDKYIDKFGGRPGEQGRRKTHLTTTPQTSVELDNSMDWNA